MKKNALYKDIFREINKSKGRFASIMLMLAVGVLIFVGLKVSGPSMKKTGEDYMAKANPPDIMIESTHGLTDEDIQRIEKIGDIEDLELGYQIDLTDQKGEAIRVENLNDKISLTDVVKGRIPEKENEILFDETLEEEGYEIGDIVTFEQEVLNEHLKQEVALSRYEFEIVGFGTNAEYLITEYKGNSNAGDGNLKGFALVRPEVFLKENPDIARITFKGLNGKDAADEEYRHLVLPYEEKVREEFKGRPGQRLLSMQDEITDEIRDGEEKIKDAREKIADGEQAIQDAKRELQEGREEYYVNEEKFNDEIRNAREKIRNGEQEIASNEQKLIDGENTWKNSQREWESGKKAYEEGEAQWKESQKQIRAGKSEIEKAEEQLKQGRIELEEAKNSLGDQKEELEIAKQRIQEKEKELAIKKREWESKGAPLRQAKAQLDQGKKELDQGESKIQESQEKINEYYNGVSELQEKHGFVKGKLLELEGTISSLENQLSGLDPQIDEEKYMQLAAQIDELKKKKAELTETLQGIEKKQQDLQQKKPEIEAAEKQLTIEKEKLKSAKAQWEAQYSQFQEQNKPYFEAGERIRQGEEELQEAKEKIEKGQTDIENAPEIIAAKEKEIEEAERALGEKKKEWEAGNQKLQEARAELDQSKKELDQGQQQLADSKQELENNREKLQNAKADLQNAKEELATNQREGRQKLDDALSEIRDGEGELASEEEKFNREKADALVDIEEGEKDLADARDALTMIKKPVYSIVAQSDIDEIATYFDSTGRLDIISNIFPILFFFIAILVSLTTMTRMVDENRGQMGIMKGLGYPPMEIMKKYFIYGALASILGSIIGIIIGHVLIAKVIANAYVSSFIFKDVEVIFSLKYSIIALIIGVLSTAIVASTVAWKSLKKKPATLMRPKAPKSGSRILLERVTPIWKRLSFIQKVTFRNLFRYKKRMWMTIIGIAGCTGLMFMGFAIRDSVSGISDKQYGEIFNFQYITLYDRDLGKEEFKDYKIHLNNNDNVKATKEIRLEQGIKRNNKGLNQSLLILIPKENDDLKDYITLRNRKTKEKLELNDEGAIITEKLSEVFDLNIGDDLTFENQYEEPKKVKITGITENYSNHFVYMNQRVYEEVYGDQYEKNADIVQLRDDENTKILDESLKNPTVLSVIGVSSLANVMDQVVDSLNILVGVIIICAVVLAFVVLYNLNNINISERKNELSTIKVLGFYDNEVTRYIYRETFLLSLIGILFGFWVGKAMHWMILSKLIPESLMLDPKVYLSTYLLSFVITVIFLFIVMIIVHIKLKNINMVEALKGE